MTEPNDRGVRFERLRGIAPPAPPTELKRRVLAQAVLALERRPQRDRWSELRWSRPVRWAWAAAVVVLAIANLLLPRFGRGPSLAPAESLASWRVTAVGDRGELAEIVALPRIDPAARSLVQAMAASQAEATGDGKEGEP